MTIQQAVYILSNLNNHTYDFNEIEEAYRVAVGIFKILFGGKNWKYEIQRDIKTNDYIITVHTVVDSEEAIDFASKFPER